MSRDPVHKLERVLSSVTAKTVYLTRSEAEELLRLAKAAQSARNTLARLDGRIAAIVNELDGARRPTSEPTTPPDWQGTGPRRRG